MRKLILAFTALTIAHQAAPAQEIVRPEIRPFAGAYIPAGEPGMTSGSHSVSLTTSVRR
jgi:hypothetical protein